MSEIRGRLRDGGGIPPPLSQRQRLLQHQPGPRILGLEHEERTRGDQRPRPRTRGESRSFALPAVAAAA